MKLGNMLDILTIWLRCANGRDTGRGLGGIDDIFICRIFPYRRVGRASAGKLLPKFISAQVESIEVS